MASRRVHVARDAHEVVERTAVLDGVAGVLDGQHVLDAAVAVAGLRVEARGVDGGCGLDLRSGNAGDLLGGLRVELGRTLSPSDDASEGNA
jgi:hypothetical protein